MATIITKFSSTSSAVPTASDLVQGELAVNTADKRLFTEDSGATIIEIGTNPSSITTGAITASGTVTSSSGFSGNLTGNVTGDVTGNITGDVTGDVTGSISGGTVAGSTGTFSSNVTAGGTLGVTGATTLSDNLTMSDGRLQITNSSFNLKTFEVIGSANTTNTSVYLSADNLTTGKALEVVSFSADSSSRSLVRLANTNGVATGTTVLQIDQSSSGNALSVSGDSLFTGDITVTGNATISGNLTFGDADTDSISLNADVDSHILPNTDDTYDLGSTSKQWRNLYINGTANIDSLVADTADINGGTVDNTAIGSTTASTGNFSTLSINGTAITATAAELNVLDGITATVTELNYTDGVTSNIQTQLDTKAPLASPTFTGTVTIPDATVTGDVSFGDNDKAIFGAGSDLEIYHNAGTSFITESGSSNFKIGGENLYLQNSAHNENYLAAIANQGVTLYYNNAAKLATTSTGIDVTGTVVSDAIQVDTDSGITLKDGGDSRTLTFKIDAGTGRYQASGSADHFFTTTDSNLARFYIANNGDISFYEDTGTTAKFFWDASAESLGIGTTSPTSTAGLHIQGADGASGSSVNVSANEFFIDNNGNTGMTLGSSNTGTGGYVFADSNVALRAGMFYTHSTDQMSFRIASQTRVSIDSSGNVGIGTDSPTEKLHIHENSSSGCWTHFTNSTTGTDALVGAKIGIDSSENIRILQYGAKAIRFYTTNTEVARIDASGNVGIGSSSPNISGFTGYTVTSIQGSNGAVLELADSTYVNAIWSADDNLTLDADKTNAGADSYMRFRVDTAEAMRIDSSGNVGIGIDSPNNIGAGVTTLDLGGNDATQADRSGGVTFTRYDGTRGMYIAHVDSQNLFAGLSTYPMVFRTNNTERMRIDSSGNLLVGTTDPDVSFSTSTGSSLQSNGQTHHSSSGTALVLNRTASDGTIAQFRKAGTTVGSIAASGGALQVSGNTNSGLQFNSSAFVPMQNGATIDATIDLGSSVRRFQDIYATNGTIQTSDRNEKQDIEALSDAEQRVAVACKGLLRKFRWKSAVEEKGDEARIHFGIIAQDLQAAFEVEGLDAGRYAMFIHSTWTDEETGEERSRMGVRYSELLAFIIAAI